MTFELWAAVQREWRVRPPVHWLAAAWMGFKPQRPQAPPGKQAKAAPPGGRSLRKDFPGGVIR